MGEIPMYTQPRLKEIPKSQFSVEQNVKEALLSKYKTFQQDHKYIVEISVR